MDKSVFFTLLLESLRAEFQEAVAASREAAQYATDEESRAESQWDTQGLEASYLAAGQAGQARQWAAIVEELQSEREELLKPKASIGLGALFCCQIEGEPEWFFFAGKAGGQVIETECGAVTVITPQSPLAARLRGLKAGARFRLANGNSGTIISIE